MEAGRHRATPGGGEAAQRELIAALNENHALYDLFIDTIARRLRALAEEASRTRDAKDAQARRLLACAGRLKTAERLAKAADAEMQREIEKKGSPGPPGKPRGTSGTQASRKLTNR